MYACRAIGKSMLASRNGGVIVNVASLLGVKGGKGSGAYAASKAGIVGKFHCLSFINVCLGVQMVIVIGKGSG